MIIGVTLASVVIGILASLMGYGGDTSNTSSVVASDQPKETAIPFTKVVEGTQSTVTTRVNYLITSSVGLSKLWKMVDATSTPPAVDFNTHAVIAVFAGQRPTTGYAIKVSEVLDSTSRLVSITVAKPDSNCMTGQSLTAPYEIVVVPATSLPFAHEDQVITTTCTN
jgi:hypothetical protein